MILFQQLIKASYEGKHFNGVYHNSKFLHKVHTQSFSQFIHIKEMQRHLLLFESTWDQKGRPHGEKINKLEET